MSQSVVPHISEMLEKRVIETTAGKVFLSVPKKDTDRTRLVLDLITLNKFIKHIPFKKSVPWSNPTPSLVVSTDTSDVRWGFQSNQGHQACGGWTEELRLLHINYRELFVVMEWLLRTQIPQGPAVRFDMDNSTAVACIRRHGTSRSESLLSLSEDIFRLAQHTFQRDMFQA